MGRLPEKEVIELMMMRVFLGFAKIFLGVGVKRLLAAERAEIIGLSLVFGCTGSGGGIDIHVADWIMYCGCHRLSPFGNYDCPFNGLNC